MNQLIIRFLLWVLFWGIALTAKPQNFELNVPFSISIKTVPLGTSCGLPWYPIDVDKHISGLSFETGISIKSENIPFGLRYLIGIRRDHKRIRIPDIATEKKAWFLTGQLAVLYYVGKKNKAYLGGEWSRHNIGSTLRPPEDSGFDPTPLAMSFTSYNFLIGIPFRGKFIFEPKWIQVFRNWPFHKPPLLYQKKIGYLSFSVQYLF